MTRLRAKAASGSWRRREQVLAWKLQKEPALFTPQLSLYNSV